MDTRSEETGARPATGTPAASGGDEVEERAKERYRELLEELRTIIPGAEVLLGFLLTVPFSNRFGDVDRVGAALAMVALMTAALATVLFLAPSAYHRVAEHAERTERVRFGVRSQMGGLVLTATAICLSVFVVVRFAFGAVWGAAAAATLAITALVWWVVVPNRHERRGTPDERAGRD